jgi:hypothetical protein
MELPQGELSFANTAEQFDSSDGGCCAIEIFEAEHWSGPGFDTTVILFDQIVQIISTISTWCASMPRLPLPSRAQLGMMQRNHPR